MQDSDAITAESHTVLETRIRRRAHEIWEARKGTGGPNAALEDWLTAEREVLGSGKQIAQDRGTVVGPAGVSEPFKKPREAQKRRTA